MIIGFIIAATVVFAFLTMIWKSSDYLNLGLRATFLALLVLGIINIVKHYAA